MIKKIPLSMTGDNLFSFECEPTGRLPSYAVCQHTVWAYKRSALKGFEDCRKAIDERTCPAIKMMLAEKQGKAVYFESYSALVADREKRQAEQKALSEHSRRRPSTVIATSRTQAADDEIRRRDQEVIKRLEMADDTVEKRIEKSRQARKASKVADLNSESNMFAAVVNELVKEEAS